MNRTLLATVLLWAAASTSRADPGESTDTATPEDASEAAEDGGDATPPGRSKKPGALPPGLAKKPGGLPPGQAKKQANQRPPGLAKKPGGLPPGQAKKRDRDEDVETDESAHDDVETDTGG